MKVLLECRIFVHCEVKISWSCLHRIFLFDLKLPTRMITYLCHFRQSLWLSFLTAFVDIWGSALFGRCLRLCWCVHWIHLPESTWPVAFQTNCWIKKATASSPTLSCDCSYIRFLFEFDFPRSAPTFDFATAMTPLNILIVSRQLFWTVILLLIAVKLHEA